MFCSCLIAPHSTHFPALWESPLAGSAQSNADNLNFAPGHIYLPLSNGSLEVVAVWSLNLFVDPVLAGGGWRSARISPLLDYELLEAGEGLLQPLARHAAAGLDGPAHVPPQVLHPELLLQLAEVPGQGQVLLVGQHQDGHRVPLCQLGYLEKLELGFLESVAVAGVHHEDDGVGAPGVAPPQGPGLVLAPDIPDVKHLAQSSFHLKHGKYNQYADKNS